MLCLSRWRVPSETGQASAEPAPWPPSPGEGLQGPTGSPECGACTALPLLTEACTQGQPQGRWGCRSQHRCPRGHQGPGTWGLREKAACVGPGAQMSLVGTGEGSEAGSWALGSSPYPKDLRIGGSRPCSAVASWPGGQHRPGRWSAAAGGSRPSRLPASRSRAASRSSRLCRRRTCRRAWAQSPSARPAAFVHQDVAQGTVPTSTLTSVPCLPEWPLDEAAVWVLVRTRPTPRSMDGKGPRGRGAQSREQQDRWVWPRSGSSSSVSVAVGGTRHLTGVPGQEQRPRMCSGPGTHGRGLELLRTPPQGPSCPRPSQVSSAGHLRVPF